MHSGVSEDWALAQKSYLRARKMAQWGLEPSSLVTYLLQVVHMCTRAHTSHPNSENKVLSVFCRFRLFLSMTS